MIRAIEVVLRHLEREDPGEVLGLYLHGSAVAGGLRPDSDVDLLLITRRSLTAPERAALVSLLLEHSGWSGHARRFPEAAKRRPLELTSVVARDLRALAERPRQDFQYGEWLRAELIAGAVPEPAEDPDLVILLAAALTAHRVLRGRALAELVAPVPAPLLREALLAILPDILEEIEGDERNTLLALARILVTLRTGEIVPKDEAAAAVGPTLPAHHRALMERARDEYRQGGTDTWDGLGEQVAELAVDLSRCARDRAVREG